MKLSIKSKLELRAKAHHLKPVIIIGDKGLTETLQFEVERGLMDHELIKIRINAPNKKERETIIQTICKERKAELIQSIGHTATIYRKKPKKKENCF